MLLLTEQVIKQARSSPVVVIIATTGYDVGLLVERLKMSMIPNFTLLLNVTIHNSSNCATQFEIDITEHSPFKAVARLPWKDDSNTIQGHLFVMNWNFDCEIKPVTLYTAHRWAELLKPETYSAAKYTSYLYILLPSTASNLSLCQTHLHKSFKPM